FFFSSRRRHTRSKRDWSSDVCLPILAGTGVDYAEAHKCSDPKRLAVYFGKHGQYRSKEYQHNVPEAWQAPGKGPGRFWGYWGLKIGRASCRERGEGRTGSGWRSGEAW